MEQDHDHHPQRRQEPAHETAAEGPMPTDGPRIYIADLAAYNNGQLHGVWLDAVEDIETLRAAVDRLLASSPMAGAEEFAIHDHDGFGPLRIDEHDSLARVAALARLAERHGQPLLAWAEHVGTDDLGDLVRSFQAAYLGEYDSAESYIEQSLDSLGGLDFLADVPDYLTGYVGIDYTALAQDWQSEFLLVVESEEHGRVWVYDQRA